MKKGHFKVFLRPLLVAGLLLSYSLFYPIARARADWCDEAMEFRPFMFAQSLFCGVKEMFDVTSIVRTAIDNALANVVEWPISVVTGTSLDQFGTCGYYFWSKDDYEGARSWFNEANDVNLDKDVIDDAAGAAANLDCDFRFSKVATGGFMGATKFSYDTIMADPIPVNFAYFLQRNTAKIPIVKNTAFASSVSYNAFGLELVYDVWEQTRNISLAIMSIVMLIFGFMIISRKKVGPQTMVTVQMALPRIAISLFLIAFSYPIGAIIASTSIPIAILLIKTLLSSSISLDWEPLIMILVIIISTGGNAVLVTLLGAIALLICTIFLAIAILFKAFLISVKIMMDIVFAPIQFAIGALPGNETLISGWFKRMFARALSIPAMIFMLFFAWYLFSRPLMMEDAFVNVTTGGPLYFGKSMARAYSSMFITITAIPLISLMVMFMGSKVDKKIEEFIIGPPQKRR